MTCDGKRFEVRGLEEVPDEVRGQTLAVRETARDDRVVVGIGVTGLRHDDGAGDTNDERRGRNDEKGSDARESRGARRAEARCAPRLSLAAGYAGPLMQRARPVRAGWAQTLARGVPHPPPRRSTF